MNKPEYSDLYKFIVSFGLILIAFAILLPWLFLRESFDSLVSASDIANLTPTAQTLITHRQNVALWIVQNIVWVSAIPASLGSVSLVGGLFLWQRKQKLTDTKDELETEKLRLEVKSMLPEQIAVKLIQEAASESPNRQNEIAEAEGQIKVINEYVRVENMIIGKLSDCFGSANVRPNQQIKDSQVDVLVRINKSERALFEIKYYKKRAQLSQRIEDVIQVLKRSVESYKDLAPYHNTRGIGLIILGGGYANSSREKDKEITAILTKDEVFIRIITLTESEFTNLDCVELRSMILDTTPIK